MLVLADHDAHAEAMVAELRRAGYAADWMRVDTQPAYLAALDSQQLDVILAYYPLKHLDVLRALHQTRRLQRDVPMIIVLKDMSGLHAKTFLEIGAAACVAWDALDRWLGSSVRSALEGRVGKTGQSGMRKHSA